MRHLSFLGGVLAITSLSLLFSCEKSIDTQYANRSGTEMFADKPCKDCLGEYIGFHSVGTKLDPMNLPPMEQSPFFFWRGNKNDCPGDDIPFNCKQRMLGYDFSDNEFFVITATGGNPVHNCVNGALGVNDIYINAGETLSIELSPCMNGNWMDGFNLVLHGNKDEGVIELFHAAKLVKTIPFSKALCHPYPELIENRSQNFPVTWTAESNKERFTKMVIRPTTGRFVWIGYHRNLNLNDPDGLYPYFEHSWWHLTKAK